MRDSSVPPRAVLIDLDGTLVDSAPDIAEAVNRMLLDFNAPAMSLQQVVGCIGNGVPTLVARVLAGSPALAAVDRLHAVSVFHRHYEQCNGRYSQVYAGVREGLEMLCEQKFRLACVTNKPLAFAERLLQSLDLRHFMQIVLGGDSLSHAKPDPLPLLHACRLLETSADQAVMVGDSAVDVAAARAAQMRVFVCRYGYGGPAGADALGADAPIDSFTELPALLAAWPTATG